MVLVVSAVLLVLLLFVFDQRINHDVLHSIHNPPPPPTSPSCRALFEGTGVGGPIEANDEWGGCEGIEPDIEYQPAPNFKTLHSFHISRHFRTETLKQTSQNKSSHTQVHQQLLPHRLLPSAVGLVGRGARCCC